MQLGDIGRWQGGIVGGGGKATAGCWGWGEHGADLRQGCEEEALMEFWVGVRGVVEGGIGAVWRAEVGGGVEVGVVWSEEAWAGAAQDDREENASILPNFRCGPLPSPPAHCRMRW